MIDITDKESDLLPLKTYLLNWKLHTNNLKGSEKNESSLVFHVV